jgi:hypothetical protein
MQVSLKQIQMLMTFNKCSLLLSLYIYILKYVIKEINLLFFKCVQMFRHRSKGKGKKGESSSSFEAHLGTSAEFFAVMVLLNFYLQMSLFIITSHLIYFIIVFVCRALRPPNSDRRPLLRLCMIGTSRRCQERGRHGPRSRRLERSRRRLPRSPRSERPSRRLPRSRMSRTWLVISHRSPIG